MLFSRIIFLIFCSTSVLYSQYDSGFKIGVEAGGSNLFGSLNLSYEKESGNGTHEVGLKMLYLPLQNESVRNVSVYFGENIDSYSCLKYSVYAGLSFWKLKSKSAPYESVYQKINARSNQAYDKRFINFYLENRLSFVPKGKIWSVYVSAAPVFNLKYKDVKLNHESDFKQPAFNQGPGILFSLGSAIRLRRG